MVEPWILITIGAAFFQNLRTALQKKIASSVDATGATLSRYLFGFPFAIAYLFALSEGIGWDLPAVNTAFFINCLIGGAAQIVATILLVTSFKLRNFAVATTYSKTEVILTAGSSALVLAEPVSLLALVGIVISLGGVIALSTHGGATLRFTLTQGWRQPVALYGLGAGAMFAITGICFRGAALALDPSHDVVIRAATVLAVTYTAQTLMLSTYMALREPGRISDVVRGWRVSFPIGVTAVIGSVGWFTALAMTNAAYVRAVGQIELLFVALTSVIIFREHINRFEALGILLTVAGIVIVVLAP